MDADAVRFCRERGIADVRLLEEGRLPFPDESFDLVTALDVIEHIDDDDGMLREMRRVLRPGGIALITVPAFQALWGLQDEVSHHKRRYRAPQLRERIARAGLGAAWTSYFNTLLFLPIAALRLVRRVLPKPPEVQSDFELALPPRINAALADLFAAEGRVMRRRRLPFGVSIVAVATREDAPTL
jgi:SAM-dependent methyltransferase